MTQVIEAGHTVEKVEKKGSKKQKHKYTLHFEKTDHISNKN